jgi:hypothetical protein
MDESKRKRVVSPVQGKDNKTYWMRMGIGFVNKDNSINVFLDGLPTNGKLQIRDWDEPPRDQKHQQIGLSVVGGGGEDLPF